MKEQEDILLWLTELSQETITLNPLPQVLAVFSITLFVVYKIRDGRIY